MKNKQIIKDDQKNPVRDYRFIEMYKFYCSTPCGVGGDMRTFVFYKQLNPSDSFHPYRWSVKNAGFIFLFFRLNYIAYLRHAFIVCSRFYQHIIPNGMKNNVAEGQNVGRKLALHVQCRAVGTQYIPSRGVRHCKGVARRNPVNCLLTLNCFTPLAMTKRKIKPCEV
jgi:hypothetical protein